MFYPSKKFAYRFIIYYADNLFSLHNYCIEIISRNSSKTYFRYFLCVIDEQNSFVTQSSLDRKNLPSFIS